MDFSKFGHFSPFLCVVKWPFFIYYISGTK